MPDRFAPFRAKMEADGLSEAAIRAFEHSYRALERNETGTIAENEIESVRALPSASKLMAVDKGRFHDLLEKTVLIKLNGGLGTGMGLEKAKSLLPVRDGMTFLDLAVKQVLHLRKTTGGKFPRFLLMNSFSTSADTLRALQRHPGIGGREEVELMQNRVPKVLAKTLEPLEWPASPNLEWCPPGHGDIFPSLLGSGILDKLLSEGAKHAFVSNSDNLGASLQPELLGWFADSGSPFVMEVTRRTEMDKKGGHLARRLKDGRFILRESAQCPEVDMEKFQDTERHRYFNTNNLWIRLDKLREALAANGGLLQLPMIRNQKTADPRDRDSPAVFQLETAMGAAIESFDGAGAIEVPRSRFAPVKTTADLLMVRSNACVLTDDFRLELADSRNGQPPVVDLDGHYKMADELEKLIPSGPPELLDCRSLKVRGLMEFKAGVKCVGDVVFENLGSERMVIPPGTYEGQKNVH